MDTKHTRNRMPRASIVISMLALIVAMSGAAVAAQSTLSSKQIKDNAIKSVDLKDNKAVFSQDVRDENLTGNDVAPDSLAAADLAPDSADTDEIAQNAVTADEIADNAVNSAEIAQNAVGTQEVADNTLSQNDLGPASAGKSEVAENAVGASEVGGTVLRSDSFPIAANSSGGAFVNCPNDELRLSGGAVVPAGNGKGLQSAWPNGANGWTNIIRNNTAAEITVTAYVLCLQA